MPLLYEILNVLDICKIAHCEEAKMATKQPQIITLALSPYSAVILKSRITTQLAKQRPIKGCNQQFAYFFSQKMARALI